MDRTTSNTQGLGVPWYMRGIYGRHVEWDEGKRWKAAWLTFPRLDKMRLRLVFGLVRFVYYNVLPLMVGRGDVIPRAQIIHHICLKGEVGN